MFQYLRKNLPLKVVLDQTSGTYNFADQKIDEEERDREIKSHRALQ